VFHLPDRTRRAFGLILVLGALAYPLPFAGADAQTRASRRAPSRAGTGPSPTPVVVPRLPSSPTAAATDATSVPSRQQPAATTAAPQPAQTPAARPAQTPTPTPAPQPTPAPDEEAIDEEDVVRVTSNLVVVPVSVTDAGGNAVQGLKVGDFKLEEEGRAQELAAVGDADQVPLDIALLFDVSSSVTKNFEFQKQSAAGFLKQVLKPIDRAAIFTIAETPRMAQPLADADTALSKLSALQAAQASTGTAFYDTVRAAARYLAENAPERNRRVILVISDGEDNFSNDVRDATRVAADSLVKKSDADKPAQEILQTVAEQTRGVHQRAVQRLLRDVQSADAVFYSINPSGPGLRLNVVSTRAQNGMQQLAETTGGSAFVPERLESLVQVFARIAAELRAQYLLQYLSNNEAQTGKFLKIKVHTPARPDLRIRSRQGYYKKG
jgi:Ca-activated chloride channel homolog